MENLKRNKYGSKIGILAILFLLTFVICLRSSWNPFWGRGVEGAERNSNVFYYVGQQIQNGDLLYRDAFDHQGLLIYWINLIGNLISENYGIWILEVIFIFAAIIVAYKLARKFTSRPVAILIVGIAFSMLSNYYSTGNQIEEYALFFQMVAMYVLIDFFQKPDKYENKIEKRKIRLNYRFLNIPIAISGACCACTFFLRADLLVLWFVFGIMIFLHCMAKGKYKELAKYVFSFFCGAIIASLPMAIYLTANGVWNEFIEGYLTFSKIYLASIAITSKVDLLIQWINLPAVKMAILIIAVKIFFQMKKKENWYFNLGYLFYMVLTLLSASILGKNYLYYGIGLVTMLIYPFCILYQFLNQEKLKEIHLDVIITVFLCYTIIVVTANNHIVSLVQDSIKKDFASKDIVVEYIIQNTKEEDTISVFGNLNYLYNKTNRKSASKYSYQYPIADIEPKFMEEYLNDLKEKKPKLIIWAVSKWNEEKLGIEQTMKNFLEENHYKIVQEGEIPIYAIGEKGENERVD